MVLIKPIWHILALKAYYISTVIFSCFRIKLYVIEFVGTLFGHILYVLNVFQYFHLETSNLNKTEFMGIQSS